MHGNFEKPNPGPRLDSGVDEAIVEPYDTPYEVGLVPEDKAEQPAIEQRSGLVDMNSEPAYAALMQHVLGVLPNNNQAQWRPNVSNLNPEI